MRRLQASLVLCLVGVLGACSFDSTGVDFVDDNNDDDRPTLSPPNIDDRNPIDGFPDAGVLASSCLIISEYIEGDGSNNKAVELYNCGGESLDLGEFGVCLVRNADTDCGNTHVFATATLAPGAVFTICRTTEGTAGDPVDAIRDNCDVQAGGAMTFNGDDRLVVFKDVDGDGDMTGADEVMDALGRISLQPAQPVWSEKTLRRCNFTPADGLSEFVHTDYFTEHAQGDASHFGVAPTEGC